MRKFISECFNFTKNRGRSHRKWLNRLLKAKASLDLIMKIKKMIVLMLASDTIICTHGSYKWIIMVEKCWRPDLTIFHLIWIIGTYGNWKNQNPGSRLELPAKQQCQSSPFTSEVWPNGLIFFNYHGCQTFLLAEIHYYWSTLKSWHNYS